MYTIFKLIMVKLYKQHQYGTHTWENKTCLKAHRNSHVKWWLKHGTEAMMSSWMWLTCPLLPTEGCTLNYVPCTKLYMTCLIFHLTLLYLKSPDRAYTSTPFTLYQPFAHTNCFLNSFIPHSVSHWNTLPELVVSAPSILTFKHSLKQYFYMY